MDRLDHLTTENERIDKILQYVGERQRANQKTTKSTVIRYMKENRLSSRETTLNLINDLIKEGKLNKEEINSQVHFLTINYKNEFIWINNALADIYDFIERCEKITKKLQVFKEKNLPELRKKKAISKNMEFQYMLFLQKFIPPIDAMLNRLLHRTILNIESENDAQLLNRKILDLIQILYEMPLRVESTKDSEARLNVQSQRSDRVINSGIDEINSDIQVLKRHSSKQTLNLVPEYDKLTNDFKQMAQNFIKEFTRTSRVYHDSLYASEEKKG
jgi:hypothetical protein